MPAPSSLTPSLRLLRRSAPSLLRCPFVAVSSNPRSIPTVPRRSLPQSRNICTSIRRPILLPTPLSRLKRLSSITNSSSPPESTPTPTQTPADTQPSETTNQASTDPPENPATPKGPDTPQTRPASQPSRESVPELGRQQPSYELTFTCKPCGHRSSHVISKQAYHYGSSLIKCPGCLNRHVISDHLKIFNEQARSFEEIMESQGQKIQKGFRNEDDTIEFLP